MLKLDVPEAVYENVVLKPSEFQKDVVASLADRAEMVRNGGVDSTVDNMLKITNDGRKLALDQRLINPMLPDDENSKTSVCVEKAFAIYEEEKETKGAQLIFCDLSTPKNDGNFNVYDDIKQKLMQKGVPENEIAFIHDANTETKKADLFAKVRSGDVRFLLGSTAKMGAGANVQDRLIALHHLDVPWRPCLCVTGIEQMTTIEKIMTVNSDTRFSLFYVQADGNWAIIETKKFYRTERIWQARHPSDNVAEELYLEKM